MSCDQEQCFCTWMDEPPGGEASCEPMGVCGGDAADIGVHFFFCCGYPF